MNGREPGTTRAWRTSSPAMAWSPSSRRPRSRATSAWCWPASWPTWAFSRCRARCRRRGSAASSATRLGTRSGGSTPRPCAGAGSICAPRPSSSGWWRVSGGRRSCSPASATGRASPACSSGAWPRPRTPASQGRHSRLSEGALERDLEARALLYLQTVESLWGRTGAGALRRELQTLVAGDRELTAVDVLLRREGRFEPALTTRPAGEVAPLDLDPAHEAILLAKGSVRTATERRDGAVIWRIASPLMHDGALAGVVQVEFSLLEIARLESRLRMIGGIFRVVSIVLISFLLAVFLERRVGRPVAALVDGMQRAETGELGARVSVLGGGEFAFLAGSFNRMLARLEDLTAGLESRVRQATHELADTNRELKEANEKLWSAQLEVGRSERLAALGQMAATIAHELGTPLNSVLGYTQLLLREDLPAEQASKLAVIESQVQRMIETIRSVLGRTRDREIGRRPVALAPLVAEALALVATRLAGRELVLRPELPPDLPPVPGDAAALRQVLINLLANAIAAPQPPGTIVVSARVLSPNGRGPQMEITVADSGHGMTEEEVRRAFEPFYTTKAPGRCTGLGLAIVDHIVRAHGGQVVVESIPGRGTTMRVRLPLET